MPCKHIYTTGVAPIPMPRIVFPVMLCSSDPHCTACKSRDFKKDGYRPLEDGSGVQRYKCHSCGRGFTWRQGFRGRWFDASVITRVLTECCHGSSYVDAAILLEQDGISVHPVTIYR